MTNSLLQKGSGPLETGKGQAPFATRLSWGLMVVSAGLLTLSAVMLVQEWMQPTGERVVFVVDLPQDAVGGSEYPLVMRIRNGNRSDIRIVGMNWC